MPILTGMVDWAGLLDNPDFMAEAHRVIGDFDRYMANGADHWFHRKHARELKGPIAYFCAEYGLHETLGIYSGGLGVLAGDHMKAASDMALPLVGVGLLYRNGYFRQTIDADGHQEHRYPDYDLVPTADHPSARARGRPAHGHGRAARARRQGRRLDGPGRARAGAAARHGQPGQRSRRPADHEHPVRARPRDAAAPGADPRRRRRARSAGAGDRARRLAPQRGSLRVPARRARAGAGRRAARRSTTPSATVSRNSRVHDPHARSRPATSASTRTSCVESRVRSSTATAGRTRAACRWSGCSRSGAARTATRASST